MFQTTNQMIISGTGRSAAPDESITAFGRLEGDPEQVDL